MKPKKTNYLNLHALLEAEKHGYFDEELHALLEAEKHGYFDEELELQRSQVSPSGLKTEDYVKEFAKLKAEWDLQREKNLSISVSDVVRKHFHGD